MTALLLRLFVKDHKNTASAAVRERYGVLSGISGIALNLLLFALKLAVGLLIGSVAVLADAMNNLADAGSSLVTIFGFKLSNKPADREHPFGHGRLEDITGLVIAATIFIMAYEFFWQSVDAIRFPETMLFSGPAVAILTVATALKIWQFLFNRKLGRAIQSNVLLAVAEDARNDFIITGLTVASVVFAMATGLIVDGFVGLFVVAMLVRSGLNIAKEPLAAIIGKPIDKTIAAQIRAIVSRDTTILGVHDLLVHNYGPRHNIATIHAEIPLDTPLPAAHALAEAAEAAVRAELGIELIVRLDPVDIFCNRLQTLKAVVTDFLARDYPDTDAHDFRLMGNELRFELEIPYEFRPVQTDRLLARLDALVTETDPDCTCVANLEHGYIALA